MQKAVSQQVISPGNNPPESAPTASGSEDVSFPGGNIYVKDALPTGYKLFNGTSGVFNRAEVVNLRDLARSRHEPQIITMFPYQGPYVTQATFSPKHPEQHPQLLTLPKDVLLPEQLKEKGIAIIQSDRTHLYIKPQAFEKDGPLVRFNDGSRKMTIVLIDDPVVSRESMQDTKYDTVRHLIPEDPIKSSPEEYRMSQIKINRDYISSFLQAIDFQRSLFVPNQKLIESLLNELLAVKVRLFFLENALTPQLQKEEFFTSHTSVVVRTGAYNNGPESIITKPNSDLPIKFHPHVTIFLGVGSVPETPNLVVYFDNNGSLKTLVTQPLANNLTNYGVKPDQALPDPGDFKLNPAASEKDPNSYPYGGGQTPGFNLGHELAHHFYMTEIAEDGQDPNRSEYDADMLAMQRIRNAWQKWQLNKDNSGYYLIFRLRDGGFIAAHLPQRTPNTT